ncbi:hypothetical protein B0J11DRAFT_276605 [Dendryphion nanum]|uniref:Small secreted protein n=1 Tax=Dendryphion nanum TaxID=256645 RepID=A0A9P9IN57_9PLEO|nr:hypothetical protein B0J11DRAFT_276605 [Dendryphion nanum]
MHFQSTTTIFLSALLATTLAAPAPIQKRGVLTVRPYSDFQISSGTAGNALAEVMAKFPIDMSNLATVDAADQKIISDARQVAESAETDAFNPAIAAAGGDSTALQNGKIKNKVLKLQLEVLDLMISAAQGEDKADKIAAETKKLNNNIALDKKAAGQKSQSVEFNG